MMISRAALAVVIVGSLLSWSCDGGEASPLAVYAGDWHSDDAQLAGRLILEGDCLVIVSSTGESWAIAFAERGTSWSRDDQAVTYLDRTVRVGDEVAVGGSSPPNAILQWVRAPGEECNGKPIWFVGDPSPS